MTIEAMIEQALRLSVEDRTELVARLLESLDETAPTDPGHEAAWTEVIDRRVQDLQEGRVELIDGSVTMARAREAVAAEGRGSVPVPEARPVRGPWRSSRLGPGW